MGEIFRTDVDSVDEDLLEDIESNVETQAVDEYVEAYIKNEISTVLDEAAHTLETDEMSPETIIDGCEQLLANGFDPEFGFLSGALRDRLVENSELVTATASEEIGSGSMSVAGVDLYESSFIANSSGLLLDSDAVGIPPSYSDRTLLVRNSYGLLELDVEGNDD